MRFARGDRLRRGVGREFQTYLRKIRGAEALNTVFTCMPDCPSIDLHAPRLLYSRREVAFQLSTSLRNIAYRIAAGTLRTQRQGGRVLISHQELIRQARLDDNTP